MNTLYSRINELLADGISMAKLKATLTLEDWSAKEISAALKEMNIVSKVIGFKSVYFTWLSDSHRTKEEAEEYIMGNGAYGATSDNVKKSLSTNMNIWELTNSIWNSKAEAEDDMDPELKAAWSIYEAAKAKHESGSLFTRAEANRIHPDKVAKFNDEALTKAYNELSKIIVVKSKRAA